MVVWEARRTATKLNTIMNAGIEIYRLVMSKRSQETKQMHKVTLRICFLRLCFWRRAVDTKIVAVFVLSVALSIRFSSSKIILASISLRMSVSLKQFYLFRIRRSIFVISFLDCDIFEISVENKIFFYNKSFYCFCSFFLSKSSPGHPCKSLAQPGGKHCPPGGLTGAPKLGVCEKTKGKKLSAYNHCQKT